MNPLLTLVTDHNPTWVGIEWPETPLTSISRDPSPRIQNIPDLPQNEEVLERFGHLLDLRCT